MSFANYIIKDANNNSEFNLGDLDIDFSNIECENVEISNSLKAPEITKLNEDITELKTEINLIKTDIAVFKTDVIELINSINLALNIDNVSKTISTTYDFEISGTLTQG